jgi:hypothetical protein
MIFLSVVFCSYVYRLFKKVNLSMKFKYIIIPVVVLLLSTCTTNTSMSPVITTTVTAKTVINKAIVGGNLITDGGSRIIEQGVCWDTITNPTTNINKLVNLSGKSVFLDTISGLKLNKTYYVRAFATNFTGTSYGNSESFSTAKYTTPTISTTTVSQIAETSAISGGNITFDGGSPITARGVCWSTIPGATITLSTKTTDGSGIGSFSSTLSGLTGTTIYYVRAYATNTQGTSYGNEIMFVTSSKATSIPTLITNVVTAITYTTATCGATITSDGGASVTARGVCWSTSSGPTVALTTKTSDGTGIVSFTSSITGLQPATTYYVRAYAINSQGTGYGQEQTFTTPQTVAPTLTTTTATFISTTTATSGGNISADGGAAITVRGICWSTSSGPTVSLSTKTSDGTGVGSFTSNMTGLTASTLYYVKAYATNAKGTSYGNEVSFTTSAPVTNPTVPVLVTTSITSIGSSTAVSGGVTTSDGGSSITARGVCWSTSPGPIVSLSTKTSDGSGAGSFTSNISGLTASTTYYVRSYATNSTGTGYGQELSFTTTAQATIPVLSTTAISAITANTAVSGGNISSDGNSAVTARGVCWSTSSGATVALSTKTIDGTGTGGFTSNITGLTGSTTYYLRAYATNAVGTAYGSEVIFTTSPQAATPTLTTTAISAIGIATASSGGNISADGGSAVTARGICWSTSSNPTVLSTKTTDGSGTGSFTSSLTGLTGSTLYYVRAYATNAVGTAYGNEVTFTTSSAPANSTGTLSVSVTTVAPGGSYQPKNVVAIWIETNTGVFVKSLLVYANARMSDLTTWSSNSSKNTVNAITGATQSSNGTRACTWNGTDVSGNVVVDGTYLVCMNVADGRVAFASFPFTKGTAAVTLNPANVTNFTNISISWIH